jgi:hypothetical protein
LFVAQPKQIPAHNFKSVPPKNHYLIVSEEGFMMPASGKQAMKGATGNGRRRPP